MKPTYEELEQQLKGLQKQLNERPEIEFHPLYRFQNLMPYIKDPTPENTFRLGQEYEYFGQTASAIGYYHNPATVYGIMKNVIPAVGLGAGYGVLNNEQTPQYKMGGTIQGTNKISNFGYGGFIGNMNNYQIPMTTQNLYY